MSDSALHYDEGKLPWSLLPFDALREVGRVLQAGDKKYPDPPRNWERGMQYSKLINSTMRHLFGDPGKHNGWWYQDDVDSETKCLHLAQAITDLMFLLTYEVRGLKQYDDRPTLTSGPEHSGATGNPAFPIDGILAPIGKSRAGEWIDRSYADLPSEGDHSGNSVAGE